MPAFGYADAVCQTQSGGTLDQIINMFASDNLRNTWQSKITQITQWVFYTLFALEFMWQLAVKKVFAGDIEKLWVFFFTRAILCLFYAHYLINISFYQGIISYIANLGSDLSGFTLNIGAGNNFSTLSPSAIISNFSCVSDTIHQLSDATPGISYITTKLTLAIMQVVLFLILAFIAYTVMKILFQTYFLLYAGFILAGFAGSSWTFNFWQKYLQSISYVAIKFLATCFIMGGLMQQMGLWTSQIANASGDVSILAGILLRILGSSIIIALAIYQLPEWAANSLAGQINLSFDVVTSFMSGGAKGQTSANAASINMAKNTSSAADISTPQMDKRANLVNNIHSANALAPKRATEPISGMGDSNSNSNAILHKNVFAVVNKPKFSSKPQEIKE